MTPKQIERTRRRIADIKRTLASERRRFGAYDDSRGLRYLVTKYFIQLSDYAGGLRYLRWFDRNFPDDSGFPEFLFESAIILFKTGKIKEAELKVFQTFCSNPYWVNKFFGKPISLLDMWHSSNITRPEYTEELKYSSKDPELSDFSEWLHNLVETDAFSSRCNRYVEIYRRLQTEKDSEMRHYLVRQAFQLEEGK